MGMKTMSNQYDELRDLHPRVNHILNLHNWSVLIEAKVDSGRLDFAAIQRHTGRLMIVECKVGFVNTFRVIDQINRYHKAFGVPTAEKCLMTFRRLSAIQLEVLADEKIQSQVVSIDTPMMPKWMDRTVSEFAYWFRHWGHEALEGGTMHSWLKAPKDSGSLLPIDGKEVLSLFRLPNLRFDGSHLPYDPGAPVND
jgi:hypothetical protein